MNMAAKGNGAFLSNDLIFQWYNQSGTMGCINEIFEHFPGAKRNETEKRSLRSKISHLVNSLKRSKGIDRSETLKKEFKVPYSLTPAGQRSQSVSIINNNNYDTDESSVQKDLRPRRTKQLIDAVGNDEDSNDSSDGHNGSRRRGNAGRVNYNVKDMISNNMHSLVHDSEGRLVNCNGLDLCDCLESSCPGCHSPCLKCESPKCGFECRSRRKWMYEHILVEGNEMKIQNPATAKRGKSVS